MFEWATLHIPTVHDLVDKKKLNDYINSLETVGIKVVLEIAQGDKHHIHITKQY
jgi:hypothetical protein